MSTKNHVVPRRFGLTRGDHKGQPSLLESLHRDPEPRDDKPRPPTPDDTSAPPISSSDDELSIDTVVSPEISDIDADSQPSPPKKRKFAKGYKIVRPPKHSSRPHSERTPTGCYTEPSNIPHSTFVTGVKAKQRGKHEDSDDQDPFGCFTSSQGRVKNTYSKLFLNIHAPAPSPKRVKDKKNHKTLDYAKKDAGGFKTVNTAAYMAKFNEGSSKSTDNGWEDPNKLIKEQSTNPRGSRRSSRNLKANGISDNHFQAPPDTSPLHKSSDGEKLSGFIVPLDLPNETNHPGSVHFKSPPKNKSPILGRFDSTRRVVGKLNEIVPPDSSGADSSIFSMSNDLANCTSSLSSPPSSPDLNASLEHQSFLTSPAPKYQPTPLGAQCPFCKAAVSPTLLSSFIDTHISGQADDRLNVRRQALFCRVHRTESALSTWKTKGYPSIDWPNFYHRLEKHHDTIDEVINERKDSFYRNEFEEKAKEGKYRTVVHTMMNREKVTSQTGYYGSKGARAMMDHLVASFSRPLHRLAKSNKLIVASGGVSAFVQAVLVPELTVSLVREDMQVDEEEAREIIKESNDLGDLLNDEDEEVVELKKVETVDMSKDELAEKEEEGGVPV